MLSNRTSCKCYLLTLPYGAFSYSKSHVSAVIEYIKNQQEHHRAKSFIEEYHDFLKKFGVEFEERYSFVPVEYNNEQG